MNHQEKNKLEKEAKEKHKIDFPMYIVLFPDGSISISVFYSDQKAWQKGSRFFITEQTTRIYNISL